MPETLMTFAAMTDPATGRYQFSKDIVAARITPAIEVASERLREWVGDAAYDDALNLPSLSALSASEQRFIARRRKNLATIEGDLAMSFLIVNLNTVVTPQGVVTEAREEGQTVVRYLSPSQVREQAAIWFDQAVMMVSRYLANGAVPAAQIEFAEVVYE